jgi:hypothetical protein
MATSAIPPPDVERPVGGGSRDVGFGGAGYGVIQGGGRARDDRFERNSMPIEPRYEIIDDVIYMMALPKFRHQRGLSGDEHLHLARDRRCV